MREMFIKSLVCLAYGALTVFAMIKLTGGMI
jgi:hypothetical protein